MDLTLEHFISKKTKALMMLKIGGFTLLNDMHSISQAIPF
jgi:hypothetical protein